MSSSHQFNQGSGEGYINSMQSQHYHKNQHAGSNAENEGTDLVASLENALLESAGNQGSYGGGNSFGGIQSMPSYSTNQSDSHQQPAHGQGQFQEYSESFSGYGLGAGTFPQTQSGTYQQHPPDPAIISSSLSSNQGYVQNFQQQQAQQQQQHYHQQSNLSDHQQRHDQTEYRTDQSTANPSASSTSNVPQQTYENPTFSSSLGSTGIWPSTLGNSNPGNETGSTQTSKDQGTSNSAGIIGNSKPTPPASQSYIPTGQTQQGSFTGNSGYSSNTMNASPLSIREHQGQYQGGYAAPSHFSTNTNSAQSSKRNSQNSPSTFPQAYLQRREQASASPSATSPRHGNRSGNPDVSQSPGSFPQPSPSGRHFASPKQHHASPLTGGEKGSPSANSDGRLGSAGRGSGRGSFSGRFSNPDMSPDLSKAPLSGIGNTLKARMEDPYILPGSALGGVTLNSVLPPPAHPPPRHSGTFGAGSAGLTALQTQGIQEEDELRPPGTSSGLSTTTTTSTLSLDRIAREQASANGSSNGSGALTPLPHPAPPPAPSAPPTASTPGVDYFFWNDRAGRGRWGENMTAKDRWQATQADLSEGEEDRHEPEIEEEDEDDRGGGIVLESSKQSERPSGRADVSREEAVVEESSVSDTEAENEEEGPIPQEYRPAKKVVEPTPTSTRHHHHASDVQHAHLDNLSNQQGSSGMGSHHASNLQSSRRSYAEPEEAAMHPRRDIDSPTPNSHHLTGLGISTTHSLPSGGAVPRHQDSTDSARENVMKGQWLGGTSAVAINAPVNPAQTQKNISDQGMQQRTFPMGQTHQTRKLFSNSQEASAGNKPRQLSQDWAHISPASSSSYGVTSFSSAQGSGLQNSVPTSYTQDDSAHLSQFSQSPEKRNEPQRPRSSAPSTPAITTVESVQPSPSPAKGTMRRGHSMNEEKFLSQLRALYRALPETHIQSLHNFAVYLSEDADAAEKAERLLSESATPGRSTAGSWGVGSPNNSEAQLTDLGEERLRKWSEWVEVESMERKRLVGILSPKAMSIAESGRVSGASGGSFVDVGNGASPLRTRHRYTGNPTPSQTPNVPRDNFDAETETVASNDDNDGLHPLPPPKKSSGSGSYHNSSSRREQSPRRPLRQTIRPFEVEESPNPQLHEHLRTPPEAPEPPSPSPSPTPTFVQVASAPKVDLELQMPRPMPQVPAVRIDPSARIRQDDEQTVASVDHGEGGSVGATPYPYPFENKHNHPPVDVKKFASILASFRRTGQLAPGEQAGGSEIPPFLHMAYTALDTASNSPSLETYLSEARRGLEAKTSQIIGNYQNEAAARRQRHQHATTALYNVHYTVADLERLRTEFEREESQKKLQVDKEVYYVFENEFVEVAYKDVKGQLEVLGGRWYEEVRTWLLNVAAPAALQSNMTALQYHLVLEAIDLLNRLHLSMEEHEHVLHNLVSDRNAKYLQVSVSPLLAVGDTARAADAERRFWVDEQQRQISGRADTLKRAKEHSAVIDRIVTDIIRGLKAKAEDVYRGMYDIIFQLPKPTLQSPLFHTFFEHLSKGNHVPLPEHDGSVSSDVVNILAEGVNLISEIVGLIKLALDFQFQPQIRVCEASCSKNVVENHAQSHGVTSPAAISAACSAGLAQQFPPALKALRDEQTRKANSVQQDLNEILRALQSLVYALKKEPQRHQGSAQSGIMQGVGLPTTAANVSRIPQQTSMDGSWQQQQHLQQQHHQQQQQHAQQQQYQQQQHRQSIPQQQPQQQPPSQQYGGITTSPGWQPTDAPTDSWGYSQQHFQQMNQQPLQHLSSIAAQQQQQAQQQQGQSRKAPLPPLSSMLGNLRGGSRSQGGSSLLVNPQGYSPSGYTPAAPPNLGMTQPIIPPSMSAQSGGSLGSGSATAWSGNY